jgi:hypothetical protein
VSGDENAGGFRPPVIALYSEHTSADHAACEEISAMRMLFVAGMLLWCTSASATDGNRIYQGCVDFLDPKVKETYLQGLCAGHVISLFELDRSLGFCVPDGAKVGQAIRVVRKYMDDNPRILNEPFVNIALAALKKDWPCRR